MNVSAEPCKYVNTPEGCKFGDECLYRHPGDIERSALEKEKETSVNSPSDAVDESPKPVKPLRKWNVVTPAATKIGSEDQFPALGSHTTQEDAEKKKLFYNNPEIQAIFAVKKTDEPGEELEESLECPDEGEEEEDTLEEPLDNPIEEGSEESLEHPQDNPNEPPKSHIMGGSHSLVSEAPIEDDGGEWIDSLSLSSFHNNTSSITKEEDEDIDRSNYAACCTGDYAMQNVLLQMNLQLLSYENKRITNLKIFTRRCRDCFSICNDETKLFCPDCGHPSLTKVPVYVLKGGIVRVALPFESKSLRGTIVREFHLYKE